MSTDILKTAKYIHCIGIGGIGISAVAKMLLLEGKTVSGSDMADSMIVEELRGAGAVISIGHAAGNIPTNTDLVIYTIAIPKSNPEFIEAEKRSLPMITYPQSLHEISKDKYTIAVSGTHGKTTTTAMIAKILLDAWFDPTVIVGSFLKDHQSNFVAGKSKYIVVEACEYRKSFLEIEPTIAVITNIDNDHMDFYKDIPDIQGAFHAFAQKVPNTGFIIADANNEVMQPVLKGIAARTLDAGSFFDANLQLKIPGEHNKKDAALALAVASALGIDQEKAKASLAAFAGTWRRFEYKGETKSGVAVYDDYGHHPTEIKATLAGARELFPQRRIIVAFQPHLYSRTKLLLDEFAASFSDADTVLLAPIYAAREPADPSISSDILAKKIPDTKALLFANFSALESYCAEHLKKGDVLITMGAGDIYKVGDTFLLHQV